VGIRFRCHQCGHELHVKDFQGGKRGKCPACEMRFRIPQSDAEFSIPLESEPGRIANGTSLGGGGNSNPSGGSQKGSQNPASRTPATSPSGPVSRSPSPEDATSQPSVASTAARSHAVSTSSPAAPTGARPAGISASSAVTKSEPVEPRGATRAVVDKPQAVLEAPGATWYVRPPSGGQYGPAPADVFLEWLSESRVTRDSLVWREGWPQWLIASDAFEDYFGPTPDANSALPTSARLAAGSPVIPQANSANLAATESSLDRNRLMRKVKRRRQYIVLISLLAALAIALVLALIYVLSRG
jgi:hypothetical protein